MSLAASWALQLHAVLQGCLCLCQSSRAGGNAQIGACSVGVVVPRGQRIWGKIFRPSRKATQGT